MLRWRFGKNFNERIITVITEFYLHVVPVHLGEHVTHAQFPCAKIRVRVPLEDEFNASHDRRTCSWFASSLSKFCISLKA